MRKQLLKALATISFLVAVAIVPVHSAHGQTLANRVRANIPFDFIVADKTLPAGEYYISRTRQYSNDDVLTISTVDGRALAVRLTSGVQTLTPKEQGVLVFNRYGNQHFLAQVWVAGSNLGRAFLRSRGERELEREAKNIARKGGEKAPATATVDVVAGPQ
jgi:frataxin-like iron-binding protein CyaY